MLEDWGALETAVSAATGTAFRVSACRPLGGGCINDAACVEDGGQRFFVKFNRAARLPMFEAEAAGLEAILASGTLRAPRPVACGIAGEHAWLALEYLELGGTPAAAAGRLGEQLAAMHAAVGRQFGWDRDNTIGTTPQFNTPCDDWVDFLRERRLGYQLALAAEHGAPGRLLQRGARLLEWLPAFFAGYRPVPALLHGDLWGGNWAADGQNAPVVFDPAVYYGDREADIAMTELFGGFGPAFHAAYEAAWPLDAGYATRRDLYNLYHLLNHYNLFGGGYAGQATALAERLLAAVE